MLAEGGMIFSAADQQRRLLSKTLLIFSLSVFALDNLQPFDYPGFVCTDHSG